MDLAEGHYSAYYTPNHHHHPILLISAVLHPIKTEASSYLPCLFFFPTLHRKFSGFYSFNVVTFCYHGLDLGPFLPALTPQNTIWNCLPDSPPSHLVGQISDCVSKPYAFLFHSPSFTVPVSQSHAHVMVTLSLCSWLPEKSFSFLWLIDSKWFSES